MRHRVAGRKLGRTTEHRVAMLRNLSTSLFKSEKERVRTTLSKAKELRPFVERLITISKKDTLHARRQVLRHVRDKDALARLFDTLAARYAERPGGYTRILKLGPRRGDNAEMAILELVDAATAPEPEETKPAKKTRKKKAASESEDSASGDAPSEKKATKKKTAKKKAASKKATSKKTATKKTAKKKTVKKKATSKKTSGE